jgi:hypothetical protein
MGSQNDMARRWITASAEDWQNVVFKMSPIMRYLHKQMRFEGGH